MCVTFGAAKDVPTISRETSGPPLSVERTNSGQTSEGVVKFGDATPSTTRSPPYSTTSGLIESQIPKPEQEKDDG